MKNIDGKTVRQYDGSTTIRREYDNTTGVRQYDGSTTIRREYDNTNTTGTKQYDGDTDLSWE